MASRPLLVFPRPEYTLRGNLRGGNGSVHGTAMASFITRGELVESGDPLTRPIYARPILANDPSGRGLESIPRDVLPVDLLHRAVRRLFEGEGGEAPVAPSVRIINLSVGDRLQTFKRH